MLGMMSPLVAVALGWVWLHQALAPVQMVGAGIVLVSIWAGQSQTKEPRPNRGYR
jgi:probable blue pigment (indigoidine) exporter